MDINKYIGHATQLYGVEEHRLTGGKGDGMRLYLVRNGLGTEFTVSLDRCADISRLSFGGMNMGYFSACGYVSPAYYSDREADFLKSFTAGFLTTCGLTAVGSPCTDGDERLPLHGTISNTPCENAWYTADSDNIYVNAVVNDSGIFSRKLSLQRQIKCSLKENTITLTDSITNNGSTDSPLMLLYHINTGYPLLSETSQLSINSDTVAPRNARAAEGIGEWQKIIPPQAFFEEQCYYHSFSDVPQVELYNPSIGKGIRITFDANNLDCFTQWKMMGEKDYVLGLEPGNCLPDGRDVMRKTGKLKFINPNETKTYTVRVSLFER